MRFRSDSSATAPTTASIPPERLLKSMLLIALYTVRSKRQFCEHLDYNLLFRWLGRCPWLRRPIEMTTPFTSPTTA